MIGNIHLFNIYLPLVLKGRAKKIITISSGMADLALIRDFKASLAAPYSISKAAMNAASAKFHAEYAEQGVLFLNICPGTVDTGVYEDGEKTKFPLILKGLFDDAFRLANLAWARSQRRKSS